MCQTTVIVDESNPCSRVPCYKSDVCVAPWIPFVENIQILIRCRWLMQHLRLWRDLASLNAVAVVLAGCIVLARTADFISYLQYRCSSSFFCVSPYDSVRSSVQRRQRSWPSFASRRRTPDLGVGWDVACPDLATAVLHGTSANPQTLV